MADIKLTDDEQAVIEEQLRWIWQHGRSRATADAIARIHKAVWNKTAFPATEWASFTTVKSPKKRGGKK